MSSNWPKLTVVCLTSCIKWMRLHVNCSYKWKSGNAVLYFSFRTGLHILPSTEIESHLK